MGVEEDGHSGQELPLGWERFGIRTSGLPKTLDEHGNVSIYVAEDPPKRTTIFSLTSAGEKISGWWEALKRLPQDLAETVGPRD